MIGAFAFFVMAQKIVGAKYRMALIVSSIVVLIAGYHYFRILGSWEAAYALQGAEYVPSGKPFNDAYRYIDWLLTVPLLLVELVLVMQLGKGKTAPLTIKLVIAATAMILLGYPGEIAGDSGTRTFWGVLSTIPFIYILYVLWEELGSEINSNSPQVAALLRGTRWILLATWGFYPTVYALGSFGLSQGASQVGIQLGYSLADVLAKAGYGLMIFAIAYTKSKEDGSLPTV